MVKMIFEWKNIRKLTYFFILGALSHNPTEEFRNHLFFSLFIIIPYRASKNFKIDKK